MTENGIAAGDSKKPLLTFAIAAKAVDDAAEWHFRNCMLTATLRSIFNQTDGDFHVMVALDRAPEVEFANDPRFEFVPFKVGPTAGLSEAHVDQARKLYAMASVVAERGGGYFMPVDMDDFVSRDLVAYVRANPHPNGYVLRSGYGLDARLNIAAPIYDVGKPAGPLDKACGTSSIINLAPQDVLSVGTEPSRYTRLRREGHYMALEYAVEEGRPLAVVPFRAVVYTLFHGSNLSGLWSSADMLQRRRRLSAEINKQAMPASALTEEFSLPERYPRRRDFSADILGIRSKEYGPTLSVAISTYRRPAGLRRLLTALRRQIAGRPRREIVVVNDGSHDAAYEAVRAEFADIIKYQALPVNVGIAAARSASVQMASGDYVVFTDDDCVPPSWWLDWLAARLMEAPRLDAVAGFARALPPARWSFFSRILAHRDLLPRPWRLPGGIHFATANVAIRRSLFDRLGPFGFPGEFHGGGEDTEFASRIAHAGASVAVDDGWYVRHEVGSSFWATCRRYWRYGYVNASLMLLTTAPQSNDDLRVHRRRRHLQQWLIEFRAQEKLGEHFPERRLMRLLASLAASMVKMAYIDGCAAALRERDRRRSQAGQSVA